LSKTFDNVDRVALSPHLHRPASMILVAVSVTDLSGSGFEGDDGLFSPPELEKFLLLNDSSGLSILGSFSILAVLLRCCFFFRESPFAQVSQQGAQTPPCLIGGPCSMRT